MKTRHALAAVAAFAAGSLLPGCSNTCPTETPEIQAIQSCSASPGSTVTVQLRLCPTCNQTGITCAVDLSGVTTSGTIHLDPVAERCEEPTSCPSGCSQGEAACTFTAPSVPDTYTLQAFDPISGQIRTGVLEVASGPVACAF